MTGHRNPPQPPTRRRPLRHRGARWQTLPLVIALLAAPAAGLLIPAAPAAGAPAGSVAAFAPDESGTSVLSPSETVMTPSTDACQRKSAPAEADDTSESVPAGQKPPAALPIPARPVGGQRLGGCGFVLPNGTPDLPPDISAQSWLVADLDTGDVVAAKDPHGRYRPASTLKLLTMNVLLRGLPDRDRIVIGTQQDADMEGSRVGIGPGGRYTVQQLMLFLMLGSGNDVANALARANGGVPKTLQQMNARAKALGALDTRAATVSGLDGPGQMTSVYDLALIARSDMRLRPFPDLISTKYAQVPGFGDEEGFSIANENKLLSGYPGALGGKAGFTDDAGNTYVGLAEHDGRRLVVTMLAGTQQPRRQWMQAASLLDWGFAVPVGTTPIGRLVASGAEATAPAGTASIPPAPTRSGRTLGAPISGAGSSGTIYEPVTGPSSSTSVAATGGRSTGGAVFIWIALVVLAVLAIGAVVVGLRSSGSRRPDRS